MVQATWKMKGVFLFWFFWSLKSTIGSLLICHLLCACLHNNSTLCQISHMSNVFNSGEEHDTNIIWWLVNNTLCNCWANFCKGKNMLVFAFNFIEFNTYFTS
jgi:hypothetical protein